MFPEDEKEHKKVVEKAACWRGTTNCAVTAAQEQVGTSRKRYTYSAENCVIIQC